MSPKSGNPEFTVIGSGIIGISSALALQKEGFRVTVVDREKPGQSCSFGNAGAISPCSALPNSLPGMMLSRPLCPSWHYSKNVSAMGSIWGSTSTEWTRDHLRGKANRELCTLPPGESWEVQNLERWHLHFQKNTIVRVFPGPLQLPWNLLSEVPMRRICRWFRIRSLWI